ncbi:MAG TPA: hypothetical protein VLF21_02540 [Candidatus Saccharimonadales bacterium]|nr:hypothetical protein [Candidatus Saccharimonadales bacterium]
MELPSLSTDAIIIGGTALVAVYGMLAGHGALVREAISVYVGIVIASTFGKPLYDYLQHSAGGGLGVSQTLVQMLLLVVPIVLLQFGHRAPHTGKHGYSHIVTFSLAVLTSMLIVSNVIAQFDDVTRGHILDQSNLASTIYNLRIAWIGLVPVAIAVSAILRPKDHH